MAIQIQDRFSNALGINIASDRINSFIWISATQKDIKLAQINPKKENLRELLANYLESHKEHSAQLKSIIQQKLFSEKHINWITCNERQQNWLYDQIGILNHLYSNNWLSLIQTLPTPIPKPLQTIPYTIDTPTYLLDRNRCIAVFDFWISTTPFSQENITTIANWLDKLWKQQDKTDQLFEWIKDNNTEQKLAFFWEWLNEKYPMKTYSHRKFQSHEELLTHFDQYVYTESDKILISRSARTVWNQRIRRESNKDKKQCNYIFSKSTINALDKLAQKYHMTRTSIIEILVESEAKHETYIKERLARINLIRQPLD